MSRSYERGPLTSSGGWVRRHGRRLPELVTLYREQDNAAVRRSIGEAIKRIDPALAAKLGVR